MDRQSPKFISSKEERGKRKKKKGKKKSLNFNRFFIIKGEVIMGKGKKKRGKGRYEWYAATLQNFFGRRGGKGGGGQSCQFGSKGITSKKDSRERKKKKKKGKEERKTPQPSLENGHKMSGKKEKGEKEAQLRE